MSERRLAWITREQRDFASRMDENIGPLFGRDIAHAYDQGAPEAEQLREALREMQEAANQVLKHDRPSSSTAELGAAVERARIALGDTEQREGEADRNMREAAGIPPHRGDTEHE